MVAEKEKEARLVKSRKVKRLEEIWTVPEDRKMDLFQKRTANMDILKKLLDDIASSNLMERARSVVGVSRIIDISFVMYSKRRLGRQKINLFLAMDTRSAGELILTTLITTAQASWETDRIKRMTKESLLMV